MPMFTGSFDTDVITPTEVSAGVVTDGASAPGSGADTIDGGAGNDTLAGGGGDDLILGGDGDDQIAWKLGDGSDTVDGDEGADVQSVTGGGGADEIEVTASADHVLTSANGVLAVDMTGVETLNLKPLGGGDTVRVGDLTGTAVRTLNIDLANSNGSPDGAADTVSVSGALGAANHVSIVQAVGGHGFQMTDTAGDVTETTNITGLGGQDAVSFTFGGGDDEIAISGPGGRAYLVVDAGAGDDTVQAAAYRDEILGGEGNDLLGGADGVILEGDAGNDTLNGVANDVLFGGEGDDVLVAGDSTRAFGNEGDDTLTIAEGGNGAQVFGGDGNDAVFATTGNNEMYGEAGDDSFTFVMTVRDTSSSFIDGGEGIDTFNVLAAQDGVGAGITVANVDGFAEVHVTRDDDAGTWIPTDARLDVQDVEHLVIQAGSAADVIEIGDLTGLGLQQIDIELGGDGAADTINLTGPAEAEAVFARSADGTSEQVTYSVNGAVVETVNITGLDGADVINIVGGATLNLAGTAQADVIDVGDPTTQGVSTVNIDLAGADGAPDGVVDTVNLVAPAEAEVVTQLGEDGVSQQITYAINGAVVETINIQGADATDIVNVTAPGAGEGPFEPVVLGTSHDDVFNWTLGDGRKLFDGAGGNDTLNLTGGDGNDLWFLVEPGDPSSGLNALVDFRNIEAFNLNLGAGDDQFLSLVFDPHAAVRVNGGIGDDDLIGGMSSDTLIGGSGDDTLESDTFLSANVAEPNGNDSLSGGAGNDLIQIIPNQGATHASDVLQGFHTIDGGSGDDTFSFHGLINPVPDQHQALAFATQGGHVIFSYDGVAAADITGVERFDLASNSSGPDFVTLGDLTGTGVQEVDLDIGNGQPFTSDGVVDSVIINGPSRGMNITAVSGAASPTVITGLSEKIVITGVDDAGPGVRDILFINAGSGADTIDASLQSMDAELMGGAGDDSLAAGSGRNNILAGGDGDDTLTGRGADDLFVFTSGETGSDVLLNFHTHNHGALLHGDTIFLQGFGIGVSDIFSHLQQQNNDVVLSLDGHTIFTIKNILLGDLGGSDFASDFNPPPPPPPPIMI